MLDDAAGNPRSRPWPKLARMPKVIDVVAAAIVKDGRVLAAQRGPGMTMAGMWEFPGGKIESGETPEESLVREIAEELGAEVAVRGHVVTTDHLYDFATIRLATYYCELLAGTPTVSEHAELRWLTAAEMHDLDWAPADIEAVHLIARDLTA